MRVAQIQNGKVVNVIEAETVFPQSEFTYLQSDTAEIGWVVIGGVLQPAPEDFLKEAEEHIKKSFSTAQLLQAKVWLDIIPHEATPKLMSLFQWTGQVTGASIQGSRKFDEPQVTFKEVAMECIPLL